METIQKKPEIKNTIVGRKKEPSVERLTRIDNSNENLWTRRYIWRIDLECSKEKQGNRQYDKRLKDMENRMRRSNSECSKIEKWERRRGNM